MKTLAVAIDLWSEALSRKWFLALFLAITGVLLLVGITLRLDNVDGLLSADWLIGRMLEQDVRQATALRPLFMATAYIVFYGGILFGIVACSDFAPSLLAPGRVEHLLSLPLRRWEIVVGTFVGVIGLGLLGALYGAGGLTVLLGLKVKLWTFRPVLAALCAVIAFSAVYASMLACAIFVRSAALSAGIGLVVLFSGIAAGFRTDITNVLTQGFGQTVFKAATLLMPRFSSIASAAAGYAASNRFDPTQLVRFSVGTLLFAAGMVCLGIFRLERKDF